jgi:hypothetical protein
VELGRQVDVVDEAPSSAEQAVVLEPRNALSD